MDNKNNTKTKSQNLLKSNISSSSSGKSKLSVLSLIVIIIIVMVLLAFFISHFENEPDTDKDGSTVMKPIFCFSLLAGCVYTVYKNMDDKRISIFGYKMEKGLFLYMFVIMMFAFLI
jgi:hypothetical protein